MTTTLHAPLSPSKLDSTMHVAWWSYLAFMLTPPMLLAIVVPYAVDKTMASDSVVEHWLIGSAIFVVLSAAAGLFYREWLFEPCLHGVALPPKVYLRGMIALWASLEAGILMCLVACVVARAMMPCFGPAVVAYIVLFSMYPDGSAMVGHGHESDDPSEFHDAR
jgi:hypothetical protein